MVAGAHTLAFGAYVRIFSMETPWESSKTGSCKKFFRADREIGGGHCPRCIHPQGHTGSRSRRCLVYLRLNEIKVIPGQWSSHSVAGIDMTGSCIICSYPCRLRGSRLGSCGMSRVVAMSKGESGRRSNSARLRCCFNNMSVAGKACLRPCPRYSGLHRPVVLNLGLEEVARSRP